MKGCVFQKQEPVNIPQAETGVLTDVLGMRWGFEIYGLLTRWNPLNRNRAGRAAVHRQERAGRRPGAGRLHAGAPPAERRLRRGRHRRPQGRAAAGGSDRRGRVAAARRRELERADDAARRAAPGRLRRRRRVRHHRALGQELPGRAAPEPGAAGGLSRLRRRPFRRHRRRRRGVRDGLRPRRDRGGRGQADDHRRQEQPDPRRAQGVRLPDGAAADGRGEARFAGEPAGAAARDRDRRRPDRHRHDDGGGRVLPGAGFEVPRALGDAGGRARRGRAVRRLRRRGGGDRARVPRARARGAGGAGARGGGRGSAGLQQAGGGVGRRLAGLPQGDGGQPRVPAEPRGDHRVLRGGRALRREDVAARLRPGRARRAVGRRVRDGDRRQGHAAGALAVRRGGDVAQRDVRARAAGLVRDRSEDEGLPGVQGGRTTTASCASSRRRARRSASSPATSGTAARSRSTATTTRATRVRSCARWRRRRTARRTSRRCSRATSPGWIPTDRTRATPPGGRSPASWTTSGGRPWRGSNG